MTCYEEKYRSSGKAAEQLLYNSFIDSEIALTRIINQEDIGRCFEVGQSGETNYIGLFIAGGGRRRKNIES
ncbi:MAG: hypothetical protein PHE66_05140 [Syntrophaceticus schinkii]|jgi:hypothetical protein|nr:hypothetical protein [Syntrophaceticus schinkii]